MPRQEWVCKPGYEHHIHYSEAVGGDDGGVAAAACRTDNWNSPLIFPVLVHVKTEYNSRTEAASAGGVALRR